MIAIAHDHAGRLAATQAAMQGQGVAALLLGPGANLRWLSGYHALALERLTLLVVPAEGTPTLVAPELEAARAQGSSATDVATLRTWSETDDPYALVVDALGERVDVAAIDDRLWTQFTLAIQQQFPSARWQLASGLLAPLRQRKDPAELAALRAAGTAIDEVHTRLPSFLRPGRTERDVGQDVAEAIRETHDEVAFVIVASGPNGASPHHDTSDRVLGPGDAVVVDIGGVLDGYCSDSTRNYHMGPPSSEYADQHEILEAAQAAGVAAAVTGATAQDVDRAARSVLVDAGLGEWFIHRTGHGIGLSEHEEPWIVEGNETVLEPGMTFSVEPGVYVPGRHGARIEDIVAVTDDRAESFNLRPHALTIV